MESWLTTMLLPSIQTGFRTGLFIQSEKNAVVLYACGMLTNICHRHFIKMAVNFVEKGYYTREPSQLTW